MQLTSQDTIVAIATATGMGAVGIVRLSGNEAVAIAQQLFIAKNDKPLSSFKERHLGLGYLRHRGKMLDQALAVVMPAPRSYTGEEVVELHCHGGPLLLQLVLEALLEAGARLAQPGEFTRRAFVNGILDLTQAEAVGELITARSPQALDVSINQLRGRLQQSIQALKELLQEAAAYLAASIDFSDESDVNFSSKKEIQQRLQQAQTNLLTMVKDAPKGRMMLQGLTVAIVGATNVGKSSLLNLFLAEERAIVTQQPGTTRDTIEGTIIIAGLAFTLTDTAGLRNAKNQIEQAGIKRTHQAIQLADITLLVLDGSTKIPSHSQKLLKDLNPAQTLIVINKKDLTPNPLWQTQLENWNCINISALHRDGLTQLQQKLQQLALSETKPHYEHALITNARQLQSAQKALKNINQALQTITQPQHQAWLAEDINQALQDLSDIVGSTTTDDILDKIFARFCIGK